MKDAAGLGFSVEGGHDSPSGDVPLTVKKIFKGKHLTQVRNISPQTDIFNQINKHTKPQRRIIFYVKIN